MRQLFEEIFASRDLSSLIYYHCPALNELRHCQSRAIFLHAHRCTFLVETFQLRLESLARCRRLMQN